MVAFFSMEFMIIQSGSSLLVFMSPMVFILKCLKLLVVIFRGLTLCCVFKTYCPGFTVTNITKGKTLHIPGEYTLGFANSVLRLQSVLSNDVFPLQSGDEVSISAVTGWRAKAMKTGVNLVWDDGDGGDSYSRNDEIGAVPSNTSSDETLTSPSVHMDRCPPMASDLKKRAKEAFIYGPFELAVASVNPKYRHEFYQKPEEVVVTIFAKGIPAKDVNVDFGEQILSVSIDVAGEDTYYFQPRLFGKIMPEKCRFDVLSTKVEIRLAKAEPLHWTSLEFSEDNSVPLRVSSPVVGASSPYYPSPKRKRVD
nr:uncharacterized protein LOC103446284 [Malus domestica]